MQTYIESLPEEQVKQLAGLIQKIVAVVDVDKIICYGFRTLTTKDWSSFIEGECNRSISPTFDLLLITSDKEKRLDHEIIQTAEQQVTEPIAVTCVVHKLPGVNEAIASGSRFFIGLCDRGILVYDGTGVPLAPLPGTLDVAETISRVKETWNKEYALAVQFLQGAIHALSNGGPVLAVFLLHQATEHTLTTLIRMYTGYRTNTHNLTRLFALTENFSMYPASIFPRLTKEETDLFNLLQRGYSDTRYKEGYNVTAEKAGTLIERVKELQEIAEALYLEKIQSLTVARSISFPLAKENVNSPNQKHDRQEA